MFSSVLTQGPNGFFTCVHLFQERLQTKSVAVSAVCFAQSVEVFLDEIPPEQRRHYITQYMKVLVNNCNIIRTATAGGR